MLKWDSLEFAQPNVDVVLLSGSKPHALEEDSDDEVEGIRNVSPEGSMVCDGVHWNSVSQAPWWHTPPTQQQEHQFCIWCIVSPALQMDAPSETTKLPNWRDRNQTMELGPRKVSAESHDKTILEMARCSVMDFEETNNIVLGGSDSDDEDDDEEKDDDGNPIVDE